VATANNLSITLDGQLPQNIKKNIHSYLGKLPETELERSAFIYSAKDNTYKALQSLGYYQADIVATVQKNQSQLTIAITLNKPTLIDKLNINVSGEAKGDPAFIDLLNNHTIKQGDKLHHGKYETLKSDILSLALQRGYFNGVLHDSNITIKSAYNLADITIHYDSGPRYKFGDISFSEFNLSPRLTNSLIPFKPGTYYSSENFHKLQHQLQSTQYFGSVLAVPGDKVEDNVTNQYTIPINVTLTPAKSHLIDFGVGYATDTEFRLSASWRTPLINKYGHFQETKFEYSKLNPTGRFIYSVPLSHPYEDLFQFKVIVKNEDYADLTTKFYSVQLGRVVSKTSWNRQVYGRYHQEAWAYNLDKNKPNTGYSKENTGEYYIPGVTWSRSIREGSTLDPSAGFRQTYNIEGAHLSAGSDNTFFRVHGRWNFMTTLKENHKIVTRAELGAIYVDRNVKLAPSLRFFAGGDQSIRGFAYQSIGSTIPVSSDPDNAEVIVVGGTRLIVGSVEYQYYINNKWRLALFTDGGSVADKGEFKPVYSVGSGLHYISPVGAIKVDLAYGIKEGDGQWRLHINLGAEL
jgi:translocation and assembly module TamA